MPAFFVSRGLHLVEVAADGTVALALPEGEANGIDGDFSQHLRREPVVVQHVGRQAVLRDFEDPGDEQDVFPAQRLGELDHHVDPHRRRLPGDLVEEPDLQDPAVFLVDESDLGGLVLSGQDAPADELLGLDPPEGVGTALVGVAVLQHGGDDGHDVGERQVERLAVDELLTQLGLLGLGLLELVFEGFDLGPQTGGLVLQLGEVGNGNLTGLAVLLGLALDFSGPLLGGLHGLVAVAELPDHIEELTRKGAQIVVHVVEPAGLLADARGARRLHRGESLEALLELGQPGTEDGILHGVVVVVLEFVDTDFGTGVGLAVLVGHRISYVVVLALTTQIVKSVSTLRGFSWT